MTRCVNVYAGINFSDPLSITLRCTLSAFYLGVLITAAVHLYKMRKHAKNSIQKMFHGFVFAIALLRVVMVPLPVDAFVTMDKMLAFLAHTGTELCCVAFCAPSLG